MAHPPVTPNVTPEVASMLIAVALTMSALGGEVKLAWTHDQIGDQTLGGFRLYDWTIANGITNVIKTDLPTNLTATVIITSGEHTLGLTAVGTNGLESDMSNLIKVYILSRPMNFIIVP